MLYGMDDQRASVAGLLIEQARLLTGMTQAELAAAAGMHQPDISAYEAGHRQPTLPTLYRILAGAGYEPRIRLEPLDRHDELVAAWESSRPADERAEWERQQAAFVARR